MLTLKKFGFYVGLFAILFFAVRCGEKGTSACAPNYDGVLSVLVTHLPGSLNQYEVTICDSSRTNNRDISIYGVFDEADIPGMSLATRVRAPHIQDNSQPLDSLVVTFNNDDRVFVIYEDDINGNFSNNVELVRGQFR